MKTITTEIATATISHAQAKRNPRIPHSRDVNSLQEASMSTAK